uniref:Immunoglobulin V-set domain-containing protein n=1 Tax=Varanus komodoensis TaxID=61221 RepID=A0A8D2KV37_VARKO
MRTQRKASVCLCKVPLHHCPALHACCAWTPVSPSRAADACPAGIQRFAPPLLVSGLYAVSCSWYRWDTSEKNMILVYEPTTSTVKHTNAYTGRETVSSDCSLHIMNLSVLDITYYILQRNSTTASEEGQAFLVSPSELHGRTRTRIFQVPSPSLCPPHNKSSFLISFSCLPYFSTQSGGQEGKPLFFFFFLQFRF